MDLKQGLGPALVGAGGYIAGVNTIKNYIQQLGSKISSNNPTQGVKIIGLITVLAGAGIKIAMDSTIGDGLGYFLAGLGAGFLADPVPTPAQNIAVANAMPKQNVTAQPVPVKVPATVMNNSTPQYI